jgi:hypothetical protein
MEEYVKVRFVSLKNPIECGNVHAFSMTIRGRFKFVFCGFFLLFGFSWNVFAGPVMFGTSANRRNRLLSSTPYSAALR